MKHSMISRRIALGRRGGPWVAALLLCPVLAGAVDAPPAATATQATPAAVTQLMTRDLLAAPGQEILMITVKYPPGGASLPHRHDAQVFVYVLDGAVTMQIAGGKAVTLQAGQTFYEGPNDVHQVSANASTIAPATLLVFMVKDQAKPASRPTAGAAP